MLSKNLSMPKPKPHSSLILLSDIAVEAEVGDTVPVAAVVIAESNVVVAEEVDAQVVTVQVVTARVVIEGMTQTEGAVKGIIRENQTAQGTRILMVGSSCDVISCKM